MRQNAIVKSKRDKLFSRLTANNICALYNVCKLPIRRPQPSDALSYASRTPPAARDVMRGVHSSGTSDLAMRTRDISAVKISGSFALRFLSVVRREQRP
ncbi:hypothetical protein C0Q70_13521 [Pomacea canaliculata]|uniref:Uncharacterized protein n=1 Tax=Pomacea canaliculata TaxID=400727 RepID=A0A2T7NXF2_POMCA|nr:hypothetical protein C0Q70_13521 [Pomacea canaliculata]